MPLGGLRNRILAGVLALLALSQPLAADRLPADAATRCGPAAPAALVPHRGRSAKTGTDGAALRIAVVEWRIRKGREQDFLAYWSQRSTVPDRSGLIAEFLAGADDRDKWPWMTWPTPLQAPDMTVFYNIGLWRDGASFQDQVGKFIDPARAPLEFEAERRGRVLLAPQRWRIGSAPLPGRDSDATN